MRCALAFGMVFLAVALVAGGTEVGVQADQPMTLLHNPHDADRLPNGHTLITDGGYPPGGVEPPGSDSRVLELDENAHIIWSFSDGLNFAHGAQRLPNGNTLISDTGNDRVIEVEPDGTIVWDSDAVYLDDDSTLSLYFAV